MKKQSSPYYNRARGPALVLELPAAVAARMEAKQAPVPVVRQSADDVVDWRQGGTYKAERNILLEFTGKWDAVGRPIFLAVGETE